MMHYDGRKSIATVHMSDSDNLNFREKTLMNFKAFLFREEKFNIVLFFNKTTVGFDGILKIWKFLFFILRFINCLLQKSNVFIISQRSFS